MVKKEVLEKVNLFNENRKTQEDYELWIKIAREFEIGYLDNSLVSVRKRKNQLTSLGNNVEIAHNALNIVKKEKNYALKIIPEKMVEKRIKERYRHLAITCTDKNKYLIAFKYFVKSVI